MFSTSTRYHLAKLGWMALAVGGAVALYAGAVPSVSPSELPGGPAVGFLGGVAAAALGSVLVAVRETGAWTAAGRRAGLAPAGGGGLYRKPDLVGTVGGRTVRARAVDMHTGGGGNPSSGRTYTLVEAELDGAADDGLVVTPADGGRTSRMPTRFEIDPGDATVGDDRLAAVGPEAVARTVLSGRAREALLALDEPTLVFAGDAAGTMRTTLPDAPNSLADALLGRAAASRVPGDPATVSIEKRGLVLDGDALARRAGAVAAVADAFEAATDG